MRGQESERVRRKREREREREREGKLLNTNARSYEKGGRAEKMKMKVSL
jgi:hypothetical protein